jgi:hypothetical protein
VIARLHAAARARDVTAPRIAFRFRTLDHEQLRLAVIAEPQREQHRREARRFFGVDLLTGMLVKRRG